MKEIKSMMKQNYQDLIGELKEDEFFKDNMIYCKKCGGERLFIGQDFKGNEIIRRCECNCYEIELNEKRNQEIKRNKIARINKLKDRSLIDKRYRDKTFNDLEIVNDSFKNALDRCKKYCEVSDIVLDNGYGIYLYGKSGVGKTILTACMANCLMEKEYSVLFTNFFEILKAIKSSFNSEDEIINNIVDVDFLFIDDLGTESLAKNSGDNFTQDKIFEIINKRYNNKKPTIFSSNHQIKELVTNRNFNEKTVDRINEMSSAFIEIKGNSYRTKLINKNIPF